jgi:hypothetical protein
VKWWFADTVTKDVLVLAPFLMLLASNFAVQNMIFSELFFKENINTGG